MRIPDLLRYNGRTLARHRFRTLMLALAISIGVLAVNLLTGLGDTARNYVLAEFNLLGKNTLILLPGKNETTGGMPPITGEAPREVTLADAEAIGRLPGARHVAPLLVGSATVSHGNRAREVLTLGTNSAFFAVRGLTPRLGQILPAAPMPRADPVCVLGEKVRQALFGHNSPLGEWVRIADRRFRVIGVLADEGTSLGLDMSDTIVIPVASAQQTFNQAGLFRVFIELKSETLRAAMTQRILALMKARHDQQEDVTLVSQNAILSAFDDILQALTLGVGIIGAISLVIAGVLIMNMSLIAVTQRTAEIGLLKALGASGRDVRWIILSEFMLLAVLSAAVGIGLAEFLFAAARWQLPGIVFRLPWWIECASVAAAVSTALLFSYLPARRAARLPPAQALFAKGGDNT